MSAGTIHAMLMVVSAAMAFQQARPVLPKAAVLSDRIQRPLFAMSAGHGRANRHPSAQHLSTPSLSPTRFSQTCLVRCSSTCQSHSSPADSMQQLALMTHCAICRKEPIESHIHGCLGAIPERALMSGNFMLLCLQPYGRSYLSYIHYLSMLNMQHCQCPDPSVLLLPSQR